MARANEEFPTDAGGGRDVVADQFTQFEFLGHSLSTLFDETQQKEMFRKKWLAEKGKLEEMQRKWRDDRWALDKFREQRTLLESQKKELEAKAEMLKCREASLDKMDREMSTRKKELDDREQKIGILKDLNQLEEEDLEVKSLELLVKERELAAKEKELKVQAEILAGKELELVKKAEELEVKEGALELKAMNMEKALHFASGVQEQVQRLKNASFDQGQKVELPREEESAPLNEKLKEDGNDLSKKIEPGLWYTVGDFWNVASEFGTEQERTVSDRIKRFAALMALWEKDGTPVIKVEIGMETTVGIRIADQGVSVVVSARGQDLRTSLKNVANELVKLVRDG